METPRRLLLADDGAPATESAREAAIDLAEQWQATLHVVTVLVRTSDGISSPAVAEAEVFSPLRPRGRRHGLGIVTHCRDGVAADEIVALAQDLDVQLLVLGSRPRSPWRMLEASVSRATAVATTLPILLVRQQSWPPQRIIIGDDGSVEAMQAGELAALIGRPFRAGAILIDAVPQLAHVGQDPHMVAVAEAIMEEEAEHLMLRATALAPILRRSPETRLASDPAAVALLTAAGEATVHERVLIAVGSTGRSALQRHMGWSISDRVLDIDAGSVLVAPRISG